MFAAYHLIILIHVLGLALGVGSATAKLLLLKRCHSNFEFFHVYFKVSKLITRLIVTGTILLAISGIAWLIMGYPFSMLLIVKLILVGLVLVLGPIIDKVVEPRLENLLPVQGQAFSPEFVRIHKQHLAFEITATGLMYLITIIGVLL
jgi:hypothetical protein